MSIGKDNPITLDVREAMFKLVFSWGREAPTNTPYNVICSLAEAQRQKLQAVRVREAPKGNGGEARGQGAEESQDLGHRT